MLVVVNVAFNEVSVGNRHPHENLPIEEIVYVISNAYIQVIIS